MKNLQAYEFHPYDEDGKELPIRKARMSSRSSAISRAKALCKKFGGPVDIAFEGDESWDERYITTVCQTSFSSDGFRCERIG